MLRPPAGQRSLLRVQVRLSVTILALLEACVLSHEGDMWIDSGTRSRSPARHEHFPINHHLMTLLCLIGHG